ncbi:rap guanine nucleotide exchange factor 2 isoform X14 [Octopus vulgaris]|uniref:Rap guanine nucleotide exchange factor 2 isoform X14 n=1 Tax=Octopus vulgaris TaxID=6645 RepID=A0AA36AR62_OCTVU|nr:rap guanine nucleotide exchange factor 2 isoform X14 [Octopus vulgaris]
MSCFGKRPPGCTRRTSECLTLEPSEMIVIGYPDVHLLKGGSQQQQQQQQQQPLQQQQQQQQHHQQQQQQHHQQHHPHHQQQQRHGGGAIMNVPPEHSVAGVDPNMKFNRMHSDSSTDQMAPEYSNHITRLPDHCLRENWLKRNSRASDTSSAYSGSDVMQSSIDGQENVDLEYSGLTESMVDSDEEEGYGESSERFDLFQELYTARDIVYESLKKDPDKRTEDDIETLLDFMRHFSAFANMTLATRRALCAVMVYAQVKEAGTQVMKDGEMLDSWSVILNGEVEITYLEGNKKILAMGNSFGVSPSLDVQLNNGVMVTKVDDCQFVCIAQDKYYNILHEGEENTRKHEEQGQVVMVTEHRVLDGLNRKGHIVIRGTSERLMQHLIEEENSSVDPTYVEDFLLTYRTFLSSPTFLANKLLSWFNNNELGKSNLKMKVARVVLLWVNNHFNDFEMDAVMCEFLEQFENLLVQEKMNSQLHLLELACSSKAHPRTVTLTRATREEILNFLIIGGLERGAGIFVTQVEKGSKAYDAGLKRGDQILEVNGVNFINVSHSKALEILKGATHLSITVKSNLLEFRELLTEKKRSSGSKDEPIKLYTDHKQRLSAPDLEASLAPAISSVKEKKNDKKERGFMTMTYKPKIRKALMKMNFIPKLNSSDNSMNHSDESLYTKPSRKSSTSSSTSSSTAGMSSHLSISNPDLSVSGLTDDPKTDFPDHVLKIYRSDQSFKYLTVYRETDSRTVVMLALQEFGITDPSRNYCLCEVTVTPEGLTKQKRLPEQLQNLHEKLGLNSRYYLKDNISTGTLVPEEMMGELIKESQISLLQLNTMELASQLTLSDFEVFREIEPTEYIDDIFKINSKFGCHNIRRFEELANREMFWVVSEVCSETNPVKRMKILKHFIKIAKHCKDCKNFNSMYAIIGGLGHGAVSRLRNTWDKLPNKYQKMFQDLQELMNPSRNMAKYRTLISPENTQPPMLPFFPVIKKDLTFIHFGNDSMVDGLINFEKLRMIAKEIRHICDMCSARYDVSNMCLNAHTVYGSSTISGVATLKRTKNRRGSAVPNAKKMYEEAQMIKRVKSYLNKMPVITDEDKLQELSLQCEPPPTRRRDTSPALNVANSSGVTINANDEKRSYPVGPKFGSIGSSDSASPTSSLNSYQHQYETDSGHNSIASSNFDSRSTSSIGSSNSPTPARRINHVPQSAVLPTLTYQAPSPPVIVASVMPPSPTSCLFPSQVQQPHLGTNIPRPPLPPYHVAVQSASMNSSAYSHCIQQTYTNMRRPPLPDYHSATQMAHLARQKQTWQLERAHSHEGVIGYYNEEEFEATEDGSSNNACPAENTTNSSDHSSPLIEVDEEQVSAV